MSDFRVEECSVLLLLIRILKPLNKPIIIELFQMHELHTQMAIFASQCFHISTILANRQIDR